jgi:hypothetical protein
MTFFHILSKYLFITYSAILPLQIYFKTVAASFNNPQVNKSAFTEIFNDTLKSAMKQKVAFSSCEGKTDNLTVNCIMETFLKVRSVHAM